MSPKCGTDLNYLDSLLSFLLRTNFFFFFLFSLHLLVPLLFSRCLPSVFFHGCKYLLAKPFAFCITFCKLSLLESAPKVSFPATWALSAFFSLVLSVLSIWQSSNPLDKVSISGWGPAGPSYPLLKRQI